MLVGLGIILAGLGNVWAQEATVKLEVQEGTVADSLLSSVVRMMPALEDAVAQAGPMPRMSSEDLMGVIAIIGFFATVLLVIFFALFFPYLRRKKQMEVAEAAILHGQELPQAFFDEGKPKRSFLQRGITQIAVGAALTVAIGVMVDWDIAVWGLVVVALGMGNVLAHFLEGKEKKTDGQ